MSLFGRSAAANPSTSQEKLRRLALSANLEVRRRVAANPSTPEDVLLQLKANHPLEIAGNPAASSQVLDELSRSKDAEVQRAVAGNREAPASVLEKMIKANSSNLSGVRLAAATNPMTPTKARAFLFTFDEFREAVLKTRTKESSAARIKSLASNFSGEGDAVRELLALDLDPEVRRAVAGNGSTKPGVLQKMVEDSSEEVANVALARITESKTQLRELVKSNDKLVLAALALNPRALDLLKPELAWKNVHSDDRSVLWKLSRDVDTPPGVLAELAAHADQGLRKEVATNPATPIGALTRLAQDAAPAVRAAAISSSSSLRGYSDDPSGLPFDLTGYWTDRSHHPGRSGVSDERSFPLETQVALSTDDEQTVRAALAKSYATQPQLLVRLAVDESVEVVAGAAANPKTPESALTEIASRQLGRLTEWQAQLSSRSRGYSSPTSSGVTPALREACGLLVLVMRNPAVPADAVKKVWQYLRSVEVPNHSYSSSLARDDKRFFDRGVYEVCEAIARNESAPAKTLESVAVFVQTQVRLEGNPDRGDHSAERWRERVLDLIVANSATSDSTLRSLSDGVWVARRTRTESSREDGHTTTWRVWDHAATEAAKLDKARYVAQVVSLRAWNRAGRSADKIAFANSPSTSPEVLAELAKDASADVRAAVAGNPTTAPPVFADLARDPDHSVRLAASGATHPDAELAKHNRYGVRDRERWYAADFELLSADPEPTVREAVAGSGKVAWSILSDQSLERLALDPDVQVAKALVRGFMSVERRLGARDELWGRPGKVSASALKRLIAVGGTDFWIALANDYHTPTAALSVLHGKGDRELEIALVRHRNTSVGVLAKIAQCGDAKVLAAFGGYRHMPGDRKDPSRHPDVTRRLAANPDTPIRQLQDLAQSEDDETARLALLNPGFPPTTLATYASSDDPRRIRLAASTGKQSVLGAVAANPHASPDLLLSLAHSGNKEVRDALLLNKSTPPEILLKLIQADTGL